MLITSAVPAKQFIFTITAAGITLDGLFLPVLASRMAEGITSDVTAESRSGFMTKSIGQDNEAGAIYGK